MTATCSSCHAPITWRATTANRRMPLDADPAGNPLDVPDGNVVHTGTHTIDGSPVVEVVGKHPTLFGPAPDQPRHRSHFATCPTAHIHRAQT